jgi:hypothetical protein
MALTLLSTLILIQVMRYVSVMFKRFENVEDLLGVPKAAPAGKPAEQSQPRPYMGLFNILGASSAFTKDIVRNMPQVCKQMKFLRTMLALMPLYYVGLRFGIPLIFGGEILPEHLGMVEILFEALLISLSILSVIAGILICETGRFMEAVYSQLKFVDSIRNAPPPLIPKLDTPAERLAAYLEGKVKGCKAAPGTDGYAIRHVSEDCILLAIETATAPDLKMVREFTDACKKELGKLPARPPKGRFIILYAPAGGNAQDIGEDVEAQILANPIMLGPGKGNAETVVQIMIEEEGAYGMFPFVE